MNVNVNVGSDFFKADRQTDADGDVEMANGENGEKQGDGDGVKTEQDGDAKDGQAEPKKEEGADAQKDASATNAEDPSKDDDAKSSSNDSLFDDDADGEDESKLPTPVEGTSVMGLALPGTKSSAASTPLPNTGASAATPKPQAQAGPSRSAASNIPLLSPTEYKQFSNDVLLTSSMDGQVTLTDRRVGGGVGRLVPGERAPPWCMSVSLSRPALLTPGCIPWSQPSPSRTKKWYHRHLGHPQDVVYCSVTASHITHTGRLGSCVLCCWVPRRPPHGHCKPGQHPIMEHRRVRGAEEELSSSFQDHCWTPRRNGIEHE